MIARALRLRRDRSGASAVEFALVSTAFLTLLLGTVQIGIIFYNYTSLQNAIGEGAREATLFPRRTDAEIQSRITRAAFGLNAEKLGTPAITHGTDNGQDFVDIAVNYQVQFNIGVLSFPAFTLRQTRRAYLP